TPWDWRCSPRRPRRNSSVCIAGLWRHSAPPQAPQGWREYLQSPRISFRLHNLADNLKTAKLIFGLAPLDGLVAHEPADIRILDGHAERLQFLARALGSQLDAAIGQVAHRAGDLVAGRHGFHCVSKAHTLDAARIKNVHPLPAHVAWTCPTPP